MMFFRRQCSYGEKAFQQKRYSLDIPVFNGIYFIFRVIKVR